MGRSQGTAVHAEGRGNASERSFRSVQPSAQHARTTGKPHPRSSKLSHKELLVLTELARGNSTDGIGEALYVSPHTVRTHIKNILRKLDANTRAHAVAIGLTEHVIEP